LLQFALRKRWAKPRRKEVRCIATPRKEVTALSILWIILIIVLVLALLGFFSRGRW
jgi:flagellar basal body-associated protein FliL